MHPSDLQAKRADRIELIIRRRPGITAKELNHATKSIKEYDRADVIADLIHSGEIRMEKIKPPDGRGRPATRYFPISRVTQQEAIGSVQAAPTTKQSPWANRHVLYEGRRLTPNEYIKLTGLIPKAGQLIAN